MNLHINPHFIRGIGNEQSDNPTTKPSKTEMNFADSLKSAIQQLNEAQIESDKMTDALAAEQTKDLHQVMITAQKASILLETTVQMQQKVIDAYNEVMRMQI